MKKILLVVLTALMCISLIGCGTNGGSQQKKVDKNTHVLIKNKANKFAIYTLGGEQVTDFIFTDCIPETLDNDVFIAQCSTSSQPNTRHLYDSNGNLVIKDEEASVIRYFDTLFKTIKGNEEWLVDENGKQLMNVSDYNVRSYFDFYGLITLQQDESDCVKVVNKLGKIVAEFNAEDFKVDGTEGLSVIRYNGKTMVLFGEIIQKYEIIDGEWNIYNSSTLTGDDKNHAVIYSEELGYRGYINEKLIFSYGPNEIKNAGVHIMFGNYHIRVTKNDGSYMLDNDEKTTFMPFPDYSKSSYLSYNTYVEVDKNSKTAQFYVEGKLKNTVSDVSDSYPSYNGTDRYIITMSDGAHLFNSNGEELTSGPYNILNEKDWCDDIYYVGQKDKNGKWTLYDKKLNVIYEGFDRIEMYERIGKTFYNVDIDGVKILMDSEFNQIMTLSSYMNYNETYLYDRMSKVYYSYEGNVIFSE